MNGPTDPGRAFDAPEPDRVPGFPHPAETRHLFGQEEAERAVLDAWREGRLHHAWLLRGPRGVGKATLAYRIARAVIADGDHPPSSLDPPENCPVARRIAIGAEPRLVVLKRSLNERTGRLRNEIVVEDVRRLRRFIDLSAPDGGWRAVIVDAADELNPSAANALLKTLEEPPPRVLMLLVSHRADALLPTIRSRCRRLDLRPLGPEDLASALAEAGCEVDTEDRKALAALAGGSVGDALMLLAGDGPALYGRLVGALRGGQGLDRPAMLAIAEEAGGRSGPRGFDLVGRLLLTLPARLAQAGARGLDPLSEAEGALVAAAAATPAQARLWAEAVARAAATLRHARAVNLDPVQTILDIFLDLDATLARARDVA